MGRLYTRNFDPITDEKDDKGTMNQISLNMPSPQPPKSSKLKFEEVYEEGEKLGQVYEKNNLNKSMYK